VHSGNACRVAQLLVVRCPSDLSRGPRAACPCTIASCVTRHGGRRSLITRLSKEWVVMVGRDRCHPNRHSCASRIVQWHHESIDTDGVTPVARTLDLFDGAAIITCGLYQNNRPDEVRRHRLSSDFDLEVVRSEGRFKLSNCLTGLRYDDGDGGARRACRRKRPDECQGRSNANDDCRQRRANSRTRPSKRSFLCGTAEKAPRDRPPRGSILQKC
jgi:hypothetical protein